VAEAMCCGVVPIRTPGGGAKDQIEDGSNGFIFPFDDSETLAMRLKLLSSDIELRKQLSIEAQKTAHQSFSVEKMIHDSIAVYEEVSL
jgi:glycosyltransferase involved in cell wall biosynthesis